MARLGMEEGSIGASVTGNQGEMFCEMGLMCATGRGQEIDLVAAHKWFNIAAVKGSARACELRSELTQTLTKQQLAQALRDAREWMTMH